MNPTVPLHPGIVHLPLGILIVLPFVAAMILYMLHRHGMDLKIWWIVILLQIFLAVGAFAAHQSGHNEEETVEKVVEKEHIEKHERAGDILLYSSILALVVGVVGLQNSAAGRYSRYATLVISFILLGAGMYTGKLGGEIVYVHGAPDAYLLKGVSDEEMGEQ
jgi:uncharacterized membrane protein